MSYNRTIYRSKQKRGEVATLPARERELLEMLTYCRPSGSSAEGHFVDRYISPLGALPDEYGNLWLTIGDAPILWSCHTDTVHKRAGFQRVLYGAGVASAEGTNCLGADCTTGVWIMANMIRAKVPGTYVFHAAEEIGGLGSEYIASECADRLTGIQFAIAFDRKGWSDIITHQGGDRCASDEFAQSLAELLLPLPYTTDDSGTFTDTANYSGIIPECTNLSVGYYGQHTANEYQDVSHAVRLLDKLLTADWSRLVCARDPSLVELEPWEQWDNRLWNDGKGNWIDLSRDDSWREHERPLSADDPKWWQTDRRDEFANLIADYPGAIADLFEDLGYSQQEIENWIWRATH